MRYKFKPSQYANVNEQTIQERIDRQSQERKSELTSSASDEQRWKQQRERVSAESKSDAEEMQELSSPKIVAIATDAYLTPLEQFDDPDYLPDGYAPYYGNDLKFSSGREAPESYSVGEDVDDLKEKVRKLIDIFASGDESGVASRLVEKFLSQQAGGSVEYFSDPDLNAKAAKHTNIKTFCNRALGATDNDDKVRIHQALKKAKWDINKLVAPTDLGVPAFNNGSKAFTTGDFDNGLGLMINGVQHAYAIATHYHYNKDKKKYRIKLKFLFYDVFGLDDEDLLEFGAKSDNLFESFARIGITAWWQLQHQFNYAPLITRTSVIKEYTVWAK